MAGPGVPQDLIDRERKLERFIARDQKELERVEGQRDARGHQFTAAIKTLEANIARHMKERNEIIKKIDEESQREYQQAKSGGGGQNPLI